MELSDTLSQSKAKFPLDFLEFLTEACSAFHAVDAVKRRYIEAGFVEIFEKELWRLQLKGKYFFIRNSTTILAFVVGEAFQAGNGFTCVGAHTDSPCLKIKPVPCTIKSDTLVLNTQPYGGGLWHTWFDRDLGIAGRVICKSTDESITSHLVRIDNPIARIPNLAIHLTSGSERDSFAPNIQENMKAILTCSPELMNMPPNSEQCHRLHPCIISMVAKSIGINVEDILDMDLQLIDLQTPALGGAANEFILSGRLDNLCSAYQAMRALIDSSSTSELLASQSNITMAMLFDHEEVGSSSCQGAASSLFMDTFRLILSTLTPHQSNADAHATLTRTLRNSFIISADMAHALHPNYTSKHDPVLAPLMNKGLVLKHNCNQCYATNVVSAVLFREFAKIAGVNTQEFSVRSDARCGSTIGPILATLSGICTVDCGSPQLSMHSIREMMGAEDVYNGYLHFKTAFIHHAEVARKCKF
eukprot:gene6733-13631_t